MRGVHLHHLVPGIIASLAAGTAIIAFRPGDDSMLLHSVLFGVGAALTLDEFAIYEQPNGRYAVCVMVDGQPRFRTLDAATIGEARRQRELSIGAILGTCSTGLVTRCQ